MHAKGWFEGRSFSQLHAWRRGSERNMLIQRCMCLFNNLGYLASIQAAVCNDCTATDSFCRS
jgi:hypothetical protein